MAVGPVNGWQVTRNVFRFESSRKTYPGFCCVWTAVDVCCALESWRVQEAEILLQAFYCTFYVACKGTDSPCRFFHFFFLFRHFLSFTINTHFVFCRGFCLPYFFLILSHPKISLRRTFLYSNDKQKEKFEISIQFIEFVSNESKTMKDPQVDFNQVKETFGHSRRATAFDRVSSCETNHVRN